MKIILNGKEITTNCKTLFDLKKEMGKEDDILILNGFQINENHKISENDVVNIIVKGTMPSEDELHSMMMARHTPNVHNKLRKSKVAIAGLGGLGSNIGVMLARIGVGELLLVDFDIVEPSNLNRQCYNISHIGMLKTAALKKQIEEINPFIKVCTKDVKVTKENVSKLFKGYEVICEAFDDPKAKAMLVNEVLGELKNVKVVASSGMAGYESSNLIKTIKPMKNLYICGDMKTEAKVNQGLMAPRVQICAGHQANMILRLLNGIEEV